MQKRQYWLEGSPNEAELEGQPWKGRFRKGFSEKVIFEQNTEREIEFKK